jgi:hemerythrin
MRITYFTAAPRPALQFREEADDNPDMFEWKDEYSVHIHSIDAQHQNLFRMAGELHSAMLAGQAKSVMGKVLDRLVQYTAMHFAHEERLMRQRNYPGFELHKVEHDVLTRKVLQFQADFRSGTTIITVQLLQFLRDWLENHIKGSDTKYVPFLTVEPVGQIRADK